EKNRSEQHERFSDWSRLPLPFRTPRTCDSTEYEAAKLQGCTRIGGSRPHSSIQRRCRPGRKAKGAKSRPVPCGTRETVGCEKEGDDRCYKPIASLNLDAITSEHILIGTPLP